MQREQWRERVRVAAKRAQDSGLINMSELARRVGWKQPQIVKFCETGIGGADKIQALEHELRQLGFILDDQDTPWLALAREMREIADFISQQVPVSEKGKRLNTFVDSVIRGRTAALREGKKGDAGNS